MNGAPINRARRRTARGSQILALSGGVGGAKLASALARVLPPGALTIVANTGDDFEHLGLHISPDIDTLTYTLAGLQNDQTGWGRGEETWSFMAALDELGGETWFRLGDRDLAIHVERTRLLRAGERLSEITAKFARSLGISARLLPMTDDPVRTRVMTKDGVLDFQRYFVEQHCNPRVTGFIFDGAATARPQSDLLAAIESPNLHAIVICPSNPFISIDPILTVPGIRAALIACRAPVICVSPIIGGRAVKGPTAKMMIELGISTDVLTVARHYSGLIDAMVIDTADEGHGPNIGLPIDVRPILMLNQDDRDGLARAVLRFADRLALASQRRALVGPGR